MQSPPKRPTLEDIGLPKYLNKTSDKHNQLRFGDFVRMIDSGVDKANLARAFNVSRETIYSWLALYEKVKSNDKS